jgi:hypothetical protein
MSQFVTRVEEWQRSMGLRDAAFSRFLGRHKSEWSMYRSGARVPSRSFASVVLAKAPEPWKSSLERAYLADLPAAVPA